MMLLIPHSFKSSSRMDLVQTLQTACNSNNLQIQHGRNQREIARELGVSESTWKRTRGVGGEWHKADIYYLIKFFALYSGCTSINLITPRHPQFKAINNLIILPQELELSELALRNIENRQSTQVTS